LEVVKLLIKNNAKVDATDNDGQTVLHHAASRGQLEVVKWLIDNYARLIPLETIWGELALDVAKRQGNDEICLLLSK
jgi:uncharacterized protein